MGASNLTTLARMNFLLLGLATMIGWNAILVAIDYFAKSFSSYSVAYLTLIPSFIGTFFFSLIAGLFSRCTSINTRIFLCIFVSIISLLILPLTTEYLNEKEGFAVFMLLNFIISAFLALMQATCLGMVFTYEYEAMSLYNTGIGISGILTSILRVFCILVIPDYNNYSMMLYFSIAAILLFISLLNHIIFSKSSNFKEHYIKMALNKLSLNGEKSAKNSICEQYEDLVKNDTSEIMMNMETLDGKTNSKTKFIESAIFAFKKSTPYSFLIVLLCVQTFTLFPGVVINKIIFNLSFSWNAVIIILVFNCMDTAGKYCSMKRIGFAKNSISIAILMRCLFFLTFILRNQEISFFISDWFGIINLIFFAFTNGYYISALFIKASETVTKGIDKEKLGFLMSFMFNIGCIVGSLISLSFADF